MLHTHVTHPVVKTPTSSSNTHKDTQTFTHIQTLNAVSQCPILTCFHADFKKFVKRVLNGHFQSAVKWENIPLFPNPLCLNIWGTHSDFTMHSWMTLRIHWCLQTSHLLKYLVWRHSHTHTLSLPFPNYRFPGDETLKQHFSVWLKKRSFSPVKGADRQTDRQTDRGKDCFYILLLHKSGSSLAIWFTC